MSQNSLVIPNTGTLAGLTLVNDANSAFDTLNTLNSGGSAPSTTEADMFWVDTTNNLVKQRDGSNANWYPQWVRGIPHGGGLRHSGESAAITSSSSLTAAMIGQLINYAPTVGITSSLPAASTVPAGCGFILVNYGTAIVTLAPAGTDTTDPGSFLRNGDQLLAISNGSDKWRYLFRSSVDSQQLGQNGYMLQAGGLIHQWGSVALTTNSAGGTAITFPETFPTSVFTCLITIGDNNIVPLTVQSIYAQLSTSTAGCVVLSGSTGVNTQTVRLNYHAFGC